MKKEIDWEYFRSLPIRDVAEALGLELARGNRALCPCHDDHDPSMIVGGRPGSKHENSFWCPVCNESGSTIDLAMSVLYGTMPSLVRAARGTYAKELMGAVDFLESNFPGGVRMIEEERRTDAQPVPPHIPMSVIKAAGLKENPILPPTAKIKRGEEPAFTLTDRAEILLDKLVGYENELMDYAREIIVNFPQLDDRARGTIMAQAKEWTDEVRPYTEAARQYYFDISDWEFGTEEGLDAEIEEMEL